MDALFRRRTPSCSEHGHDGAPSAHPSRMNVSGGVGLALDPQAELGALGGDERVGVTDADDLSPTGERRCLATRFTPRGQFEPDGALGPEVVGVDDDAADRAVLVDADLLGAEHELDAAPT